jgi:hypothetical protein
VTGFVGFKIARTVRFLAGDERFALCARGELGDGALVEETVIRDEALALCVALAEFVADLVALIAFRVDADGNRSKVARVSGSGRIFADVVFELLDDGLVSPNVSSEGLFTGEWL